METLLVGALIMIGVAALAVAGQVLVRRLTPPDLLASAQHSVGDIFIPATSALYGVLVAFILAGTLNDYQSLRSTVAVEFNALVDLARIAQNVPGPGGDGLRSATLAYARSLALDEWPHLAESEADPRTTKALSRLWRAVSTFSPSTAGEANLHAAALDMVTTIATQRRLRILAAGRSIPAVLWWILGFGAVIIVGYGMFAALPSRRLQGAFAVGLAVTIALSLFVIYVLVHPVQFEMGLDRIDPDSLRELLQPDASPS